MIVLLFTLNNCSKTWIARLRIERQGRIGQPLYHEHAWRKLPEQRMAEVEQLTSHLDTFKKTHTRARLTLHIKNMRSMMNWFTSPPPSGLTNEGVQLNDGLDPDQIEALLLGK